MNNYLRPYLIVPKLIQQPTWGGEYIVNLKKLTKLPYMSLYRIGQSYELFSGSKLLTQITDSDDPKFCPEIGYADVSDVVTEHFSLSVGEYLNLSDLILENPAEMLGQKVVEKFGVLSLLIKINQSKGNSFQLHVRPGVDDKRWKPKPESWYYLERGLLTCGIRSGISVEEYKQVCVAVDEFMHDISNQVTTGALSIEEAREKAKVFVSNNNPREFVNFVEANKYDVFDMSKGGLHHSWEEDDIKLPLGNVIYEVQCDQMDPVSTVRSFDQGKIKDNGTIRELAIEDYFKYLDVSAEGNNVDLIRQTSISTPYYVMDVLNIKDKLIFDLPDSFVHLYVREGEVTVETEGGLVHMTAGYSCFVPKGAAKVEIKSGGGEAVVLSTYLP